jgi:hypothetical protein
MGHGPTRERWAVTSDDAGIAALIAPLQTVLPILMVLKATEGYPWAVVAALAASGLPLAVVNPRQARDVAKATGQLATTDVLDARAVAHFAEVVRPMPRPLPDGQAAERRTLLVRRRPSARDGRQNRTASGTRHAVSRRISQRFAQGCRRVWQPLMTTWTPRGVRVRSDGSTRPCSVVGRALAQCVRGHGGSSDRNWAR